MTRFIEEKIGALEKFVKRWEEQGEIEATVEVARTTKHHNKGDIFYAEVNIELPGKLLRAEHEDQDLRLAIDKVKDKIKREITRFKEKKDSK